jgi:phosphoribosyl-AMP cyclohydrolase
MSVFDSDALDFDKQNGLITAVVQDARSHRVLMVGYMNREAFDKTLSSGRVTFYSRSRKKLWVKGESSGHHLLLKSISTDCDGDALLVEVEPLGPGVCHEGFSSCFYRKLEEGRWIESEARAYDPATVYGVKA